MEQLLLQGFLRVLRLDDVERQRDLAAGACLLQLVHGLFDVEAVAVRAVGHFIGVLVAHGVHRRNIILVVQGVEVKGLRQVLLHHILHLEIRVGIGGEHGLVQLVRVDLAARAAELDRQGLELALLALVVRHGRRALGDGGLRLFAHGVLGIFVQHRADVAFIEREEIGDVQIGALRQRVLLHAGEQAAAAAVGIGSLHGLVEVEANRRVRRRQAQLCQQRHRLAVLVERGVRVLGRLLRRGLGRRFRHRLRLRRRGLGRLCRLGLRGGIERLAENVDERDLRRVICRGERVIGARVERDVHIFLPIDAHALFERGARLLLRHAAEIDACDIEVVDDPAVVAQEHIAHAAADEHDGCSQQRDDQAEAGLLFLLFLFRRTLRLGIGLSLRRAFAFFKFTHLNLLLRWFYGRMPPILQTASAAVCSYPIIPGSRQNATTFCQQKRYNCELYVNLPNRIMAAAPRSAAARPQKVVS